MPSYDPAYTCTSKCHLMIQLIHVLVNAIWWSSLYMY